MRCFSALWSGLTPPPPTIKLRWRCQWKMHGALPPPVIRPPNAAANHQFIGAQLHYSLLKFVVLVRWLRWGRRCASTSLSSTLETLVCSCAIQYSQVWPRFVAAPALRALLARCAGKSSVQTHCRNVQLLARPITAVPRRSLCTSVQRLSKAASSIRYSEFLGGPQCRLSTLGHTGLLCGRPVALELSTRQLERSGSWQGQLQTFAEDASIFTVQKHLAY